jgi:acetyltransferase-like isoleucine patch superfamily enzyme
VECKGFTTNGIPYISIARSGRCIIDIGFTMNNGLKGNPIGRPQPCVFFVDKEAELIIGKNVGISSTALVAHKSITIGDNVKIGGGVCIYDTDFHSINSGIRSNPLLDRKFENKRPVKICDNVFIGSHSTILKGVTIGENSVIGACSVVTKNVPADEIWAGNPARFIKKIETNV